MIEARRHPRVPVEFQALRRSGEAFLSERGLDISAGGFALETDDALKPRSEWAVLLTAPDGSCEVQVHARVAHVRACRSGRASFEIGFELLRLEAAVSTAYEELLRALFFSADGRRGERRLRVNSAAVWIADGGAPEPVTLVDVSRSGARIRGASSAQAKASGALSMISVADGEMQDVRATVAWSSGDGDAITSGVRFGDVAAHRAFLERVIDAHLFSSAPWRPPPRPPPARFRVGDYEVHAAIAFGGMAEIFRGQKVHRSADGEANADEELVALKRLRRELAASPHAVKLFQAEAELGRTLRHRALVRTHELLAFGKEHWLVMDYVDGRDLSRVLAAIARHKKPPDVRAIVAVGLEVLAALETCHAAKVIHGDVTTSNVLLSSSGEVKLVDLGVATTPSSGPGQAGVFSGKLPYVSPELVEGEPPTPQCDVYQTGVLLYEALTGVRPFQGHSPEEIRKAVKRGAVPPSRLRAELPAALEQVILSTLSLNPKKRPAGARALIEALQATGCGSPPEKLASFCERLVTQAAGRDILEAPPPPVVDLPFGGETEGIDEVEEVVESDDGPPPVPPPFEEVG